ncbi:GIY-YIG nuclease family protein [Pseudonocardia yunnanensis]|uniref:GIY-YIG nuclease family protein n=1 Tax=Pseudonocardia yunnanensis TaxID=58107 RepID=A0ABW4FAD6_9PSEU
MPDTRLLYVGLAKLRSRLGSNHLREAVARRSIARWPVSCKTNTGTRLAGRIASYLVDEDETRLPTWMSENLRVSWCEHPRLLDVD